MAFLTVRSGFDLDTARTYCETNLAKYKVPEEFRIVGELPKTSLGKIEKKVLRELARNPA